MKGAHATCCEAAIFQWSPVIQRLRMDKSLSFPILYIWDYRCMIAAEVEEMAPPSKEHGQLFSLLFLVTDDCGFIGICTSPMWYGEHLDTQDRLITWTSDTFHILAKYVLLPVWILNMFALWRCYYHSFKLIKHAHSRSKCIRDVVLEIWCSRCHVW